MKHKETLDKMVHVAGTLALLKETLDNLCCYGKFKTTDGGIGINDVMGKVEASFEELMQIIRDEEQQIGN